MAQFEQVIGEITAQEHKPRRRTLRGQNRIKARGGCLCPCPVFWEHAVDRCSVSEGFFADAPVYIHE